MARRWWLLITFPCNVLLAAVAYAAAEGVLLTVFVLTGRAGLLQAADWITRALYAVAGMAMGVAAWRQIRRGGP